MRTIALALAGSVALIASPALAQTQPTNEAVKTESASPPATSTAPTQGETQTESAVKKPEAATAPTAETQANK
ncbi:hypothetical protein [Vitreimonas flagellata]|uniref:hypothetical protein n=1 Tax=Vitreimonas flagellata TaxID=2560861 RepID=UPI001074E73A|nr:hypothetical protein [Vitreimonas flagellata]